MPYQVSDADEAKDSEVRRTGQRVVYETELPGTDTRAVISTPECRAPSPTLILHPGGRLRPDDYDWLSEPLATAGFKVVGLYQRGRGSATGTASDFAGAIQQADLRDAVLAVRQMEGVDPLRIGLLGHSMGGTLSLLNAGTQSGLAASVMAIAPMCDLVPHMEYLRQVSRRDYERIVGMIGDESGVEDDGYILRSPVTYAANITIPVFLLTGANDRVCPPYQAELMKSVLINSPLVKYVILDDADHFLHAFNFKDSYKRTVASMACGWFRSTIV